MNKDLEIRNEIRERVFTLEYLNYMLSFTEWEQEKLYYKGLIQIEERKINSLRNKLLTDNNNPITIPQQREFTLEELSRYDGAEGRPAYVAINNIVYDVSLESTWGGGTHFSLYAGKDLTDQFIGCHGREEILANLPRIGVIKVNEEA